MLARHAESLFWTGRYLERAEDTARMLDVTYHGLLESPPHEAQQAWLDLLAVLNLEKAFVRRKLPVDASSVSEFLVLDPTAGGAIVSAVGRARENARSVRELVSTEFWEAVNSFYLELQARDLHNDLTQQPYELYGLVKRRCQTVAGVAAETMPRDDGWRFLMLGWMLERAEMTCRLLNVRYSELASVAEVDRFHVLLGVLKSASSSEAFRKVYGASMDPTHLVEFLLLARNVPRSVLYCLRQAEKDLLRLGPADELGPPQRLLGRIRSELEFLDVPELLADGLHEMLDHIQSCVREVADAIAFRYFRNLRVEITPVTFTPAAEPVGPD
jgi:uncharacterized alpha-E superfamily protein